MLPLFFVVCLNVCGPQQFHKTGEGLGLVQWRDHPPGRRRTWDTVLQGRRRDGHDWAGKACQNEFPVSWHTSLRADDRSYSWNLSASMTSLLYSCNTKNQDIHKLFFFYHQTLTRLPSEWSLHILYFLMYVDKDCKMSWFVWAALHMKVVLRLKTFLCGVHISSCVCFSRNSIFCPETKNLHSWMSGKTKLPINTSTWVNKLFERTFHDLLSFLLLMGNWAEGQGLKSFHHGNNGLVYPFLLQLSFFSLKVQTQAQAWPFGLIRKKEEYLS